MNIEIVNVAACLMNAIVIVVGMFEDGDLVGRGALIDAQSNKLISGTIANSGFHGKIGEHLFVLSQNYENDFKAVKAVIVVGLGKESDFNAYNAQKVGSSIVNALRIYKVSDATILLDVKNESFISYAAFGAAVKNYHFRKYKTNQDGEISKKDEHFELKKMIFAVDNESFAGDFYNKDLQYVARSTNMARDYINEPPNVLFPESYADSLKAHAKSVHGLDIKIFDAKDLKKLGMDAMLGVAQGSAKEARMVVFRWNGDDDKNASPIAILGKGVTFDTGGVSLKPPKGMWDMKYDMAGSAVAFATINTLAMRGAKINAVAVLGLVENAIDGNAQRPSDVVRSASGQTIEVDNTDAEGRLLLADLLHYVQVHHKPKMIIDLATLTGSIGVALGSQRAGLFSNNDELANDLFSAGEDSHEKLWKMPMDAEYDKYIDSDIADMRNISISSTGGDSIIAAKFLQRFVKDSIPWAHLDIANVAWNNDSTSISPKGPSGYGVYLLHTFLKKHEK